MQKNNLIPFDGEVYYLSNWVTYPELLYHQVFTALPWSPDKGIMFGKPYVTERKMAWIAPPNLSYTYSGHEHEAIEIPVCMEALFERVKLLFPEVNSCLANYYPHGMTNMGYHADNEKELGINPTILSVSLGAPRKFKLKHNIQKTTVDIILGNGSLLIMKGETQHFWKHSLPKSAKVKEPRINLTFRKIIKP